MEEFNMSDERGNYKLTIERGKSDPDITSEKRYYQHHKGWGFTIKYKDDIIGKFDMDGVINSKFELTDEGDDKLRRYVKNKIKQIIREYKLKQLGI